MNKKSIFYGLILLLTLSLTLGVVSASDNFANETVGVSLETHVNDVQLEVNNEEVSKMDSNTLSDTKKENVSEMDSDTLLESKNEDVVLENDESILGLKNSLSLNDELLKYGEIVTTQTPGPDNVLMSNGYTAYCVNTIRDPPGVGAIYSVQPTSIVYHSWNNKPVSNLVKLAIVYYADNPAFHEKISIGSGQNRYSSRLQHLIWYFAGYIDSGNYDNSVYLNELYNKDRNYLYSAYFDIFNRNKNGEKIPDHYTFRYNSTHNVTYDFVAFQSSSNYQNLLGYKKFYTPLPTSYEIQKVTLTPKVLLNDKVIFELIYKNTGGIDLDNVFIVEENWDDGLEYDSFIDYGNIWIHSINNEGKHVWTLKEKLPAYTSKSLHVIFNTLKVGNFTNYISSGDKTTNNTTTVYNPGMKVTKKSLTPSVKVGEQTLFLITVENTGRIDLGNVFVEEQIPDGLTYADYHDKSLWRKDGNTFYYNNVLKVGESANFTIIFNTHINGTFVNCVVAGSNETENKTTNNTTTVKKPGIDVNKKSLTPRVKSGEQTKFLITVWNTGELDLGNVFVKETMPADLEYADYTNKNLWRKDGDIFYYNNILKVGESANFTIIFNTNKTGSFTNCVVAGSNETENKTTENNTTVYKPGMEVTKISLTPNVKVGEQTLFMIIVKNTGDVDLGNVFVEEQIPDGLTFADYNDKTKWGRNGNIYTYLSDLKVGESANFTIAFNTHVNGTFVNCVVAGSNETDNKTTNNTTTVKKPNMEVTKKSLTPSVNVGEQTLFLITVRNTGDVDLGNVFVEEQIPDGLTYADYTDKTQWRKVGNIFYYNNILKVGESANFTIAFNTHVNGTFVNCVVAGSNETENKTTNNTTTVKKPNMDVKKISETQHVYVGDKAIFTIVVTNTGELDLTNVFVKEQIPDGLTYLSFNGRNWNKVGDVFNYNGILAPGADASFNIAFNTTRTGTFTNVVVAGSDKTENKTTNNTTTVYKPDLKVEKITIDPIVVVGNQVRFEIVVSNIGQKALSNVFIEESQYDGLTFDHAIINGHWSESVVNGKHRWTLNSNLLVGEKIALNVVFNTTRTGTFTNVVVAGSNETENKTTENKTKVIEPKLDVQKITLTPMVHVGDKTSFEIVVRNTGDVKLTNVYVEETSYAGLTYDSFVKNSEWTYSTVNGKHRWTLNKVLYPHEVSQFIVVFNTTEVGTFTNVVTAGSDNTPEKPAENTTIVYNETPEDPMSNSTRNPDLSIEKVALDKLLVVGQKAQFEIIVQNTGNVALSKVTVYEESFDGLTYDSWEDFSGMWSKNSDLSWTYNDILYPGEYASFFVTFNTNRIGDFNNIVSVDSNETSKKRANDNVVVIAPSLSVEKITLNKTVNLGEQVTFEIIVHNTGSTDLTNVVVREDQFEGLKYSSFVDYTGNWKYNGDLTWTLTNPLKAGEYSGFFVVFDTTRAGDFVNVVVAKSNEVPETPAHNNTKVITPENPSYNPSMTVDKYTINRTVYLGEQTMFEIVVRNTGDVDLKDVFVIEAYFDQGLTYSSFYPTKGIWTHIINNQNFDQFNLRGTLRVGESASFIVVFDTSSEGLKTNIVTAGYDNTVYVNSYNETEVIYKHVPEIPLIEIPEEPGKPVNNETPDEPAKPVTPEPQNNELPATGNPLVMVLLALIALGAAGLRRKD